MDDEEIPQGFWDDDELLAMRDSTHSPDYPFHGPHDYVHGKISLGECNHPSCVARVVMES